MNVAMSTFRQQVSPAGNVDTEIPPPNNMIPSKTFCTAFVTKWVHQLVDTLGIIMFNIRKLRFYKTFKSTSVTQKSYLECYFRSYESWVSFDSNAYGDLLRLASPWQNFIGTDTVVRMKLTTQSYIIYRDKIANHYTTVKCSISLSPPKDTQ